MNRIAAVLFVSILAAAPGDAVELIVNTNAYADVYDGSLSLEEAVSLAAGEARFCWSAAEASQTDSDWFLWGPDCYRPLIPFGYSTNDRIIFDDSVASVQITQSNLVLRCGDALDGIRTSPLPNVRLDFQGHTGVDVRCSDLGRPDVQVRNLTLDHAASSGIFGPGTRGLTIDGVESSDNQGDGVALVFEPTGPINPRRIQVSNSVFVRNTGFGIRIEAVTGGDDPADHEVTIVNNLVGLESLNDGAANGNSAGGIRVVNSRRAKVGGTISNQRNVISGNSGNGLELSGPGLTEAQVFNNWIGIRGASGNTARGNGGKGIRLFGGASANKIGQDSTSGNVVSGNGNDGITIDGSGTDGNLVVGNTVGLNAARTAALPNGASGVALLGGAKSNIVGQQTAKNVISGNANRGVFVADPGTDSNEVRYNWIGTVSSIQSIANGGGGVLVTAGTHNARIGPGNVISGNNGNGIEIAGSGTLATLVDGNTIGLNPAGTVQLPNTSHGVLVHLDADSSEVSGNTIARNLGDCIQLADSGTNGSQVLGNWLTNCLGDGLSIQGAGATAVGGLADGTQPNNIYDNGGAAVRVAAGAGNRIRGNGMGGNAFEIAHGPAVPAPGIAPNDALDADSGGNLQQNSPVLLRAITSPTAWLGAATLYSAPNTTFQVDYYGGGCGADGRGEPAYYLGTASFTTNGQGFADVSYLGGVHVTQSHLMATATDPAGNTSQLSVCRAFNEAANLVFDDGFESGFVDGWSSWARPQYP